METNDEKLQEIIDKIPSVLTTFFNSSYIPLLGWSCGFLILTFYFPQIIITTYVWGKNCIETGIVTPFPMKATDLHNLVYLLITSGVYACVKRK